MVIFDALVREQGISAAARRLGVSKSHISKQLALLETALGAQLVQRTTRRFGLTELGQEYARHCRALVAVALEAESMVAERRGKVSIHRNSIDTGKMRRSSLDPTFLLA